jgi:hypothetical protein
VYDIAVRVKADTTNQLKKIVRSIRWLNNVRATLTMFVVEEK